MPEPLLRLPAARALTLAGAALTILSTFLAWTWTTAFPGNLTVNGYPGGLQTITLTGGILTLLHALAGHRVKGLRWLAPAGTTAPTVLLALGTLATTWYTLGAITTDLGGLAHLEPGAYVAAAATLLTLTGALALPTNHQTGEAGGAGGSGGAGGAGGAGGISRAGGAGEDTGAPGARPHAWHRFRHTLTTGHAPRPTPLPAWAEILVIAAAFALGLAAFTYGIDTEYGELFVGYLLLAVFALTALGRSGLTARLSALTAKHRNITLTAAFAAAVCFPFLQTNDAYANLATSILIFATVALGLNVVVGLAGLLDLGYVAFLGVGAYTAALVSGSPESAVGVHFPFWAAVLTGIGASLVFGVLIGAPTLRLRGDYLAIVTLGFGEIFRITMLNLNGKTGPDITNGSMGIPNIPELDILGFNFGKTHNILGAPIGRFGNYYLLMLLATLLVILVFRRAAESRIGRAWVAIREDETAATAMGINAFRLKLLAFALGAALAGLAGTVHAHVITTATPDQYQFAGTVPPNSAFLLAAVILGGMGTISGPVIGAALLYLIPNKMDFMQDYQLLLFGLALILLMRFRPEGIVADRRKQLEFRETGQLDVPEQGLPDGAVGVTKAEA
ncbi:branched-chain amino acid ABC transporter permease [Streptomyces eurocidicus]|uniref:Branched-chain amino acid ABC transporter permease n=1 Tax=Streptomyces eurocidicus TaxID=66423 RepID=A0A2N8P3P5_STREU|nr:branched-chain amino acid ABC transporter permease [Streptomyces eurocidicus]MBB5118455.1 branched-chain amino acid transport system permease protein [Streptomyces eurocidicus]MBF6051907.1 branched-chain amino acid ABC transporter permease [Streptomyces eurocidicus]PNE35645.1 branched-chain amino acid ABC transporter permease [Streptomyces eurocidicus]